MTWSRMWFVPAMLVVLMVAWFLPGPLPHAAMIRDLATILVFVITGAALPLAELRRAAMAWQPAVLIHLIGLGGGIAVAMAMQPLLTWFAIDPTVRAGVVMVAMLPTTITSCVAYTRIAGGATAVAMIHAVISSAAGIFLVPVVAAWWLDQSAGGSPLSAIAHLTLIAVVPFIIGQCLRLWTWLSPLTRACERYGTMVTMLALLVVLFLVFAESFTRGATVAGRDIAAAAIAAVLLHVILLLMAWYAAALCTRTDRIAVLFAASQKSVVLGVPMVAVLCAHDTARAALLIVPLLCFHPFQLILDAVIAARLSATSD